MAGILLLAFGIPLIVRSATYLHILVLLYFYACLTTSWNLVGGFAGVLPLGHAAFVGIGAYTSTILSLQYGVSPWLGMLAGGILATIAGVLIGLPTLKMRGAYFALATIAFAEGIRVMVESIDFLGPFNLNGPRGLQIPPTNTGFADFMFAGEKINGKKPWDLCKSGLARTFQIVKPFASKSVLYNVTVGGFISTGNRRVAEEKALQVLEELNFADKKDVRAGNLTIADRKRLEIARALATGPQLLLLDEVMAGLRPSEVDEMVAIIKHLRDTGVTIFVIEHIMRAIMALSDRIVVIQFGRKIAEGTPDQIASDENVIRAYLGEDYAVA